MFVVSDRVACPGVRMAAGDAAYCFARTVKDPVRGVSPMLWLIFFILILLWLLGFIGSYTLGGWLHLLLIAAVIILIINLATGRPVE